MQDHVAVARQYFTLALEYDNTMDNTRYNLIKIFHNRTTTPTGEVRKPCPGAGLMLEGLVYLPEDSR